jgi:hypothetical protein
VRVWPAVALIALLGASARAALPPPPPGMVATNARTVSCARTMPRLDVIGSSHGGPLGFEAADGRQYAAVSASVYALIRADGCRILPRRPAFSSRGLGRRWEFRAEYFEAKQFGCTYGGPLVVHVSIERARGRYVASHFALWTAGGGRQLAVGEIRATGRAWLRVATSCRLRYSR